MASERMQERTLPKVYAKMKNTWYRTLFPLEFENTEANAAWLQTIANNTAANRRYVYQAQKRIVDASTLPRGHGPAVICASGSSLNPIAPLLKDFNGTVFCTQSQARTLVYHGRAPDYVIAVDSRRGQNLWDVPDPHVWDNTVFLAHPGVHPDLFRGWPATIGLYRILDPESIWYSRILPVLWPGVNARMVPYADSMAGMLSFAIGMGYSPILLAGCDYSGPRFDEWRFVPPGRDLHTEADANQPWTPTEHRIQEYPLRTDGEWKFIKGSCWDGNIVAAASTGSEPVSTDIVSIHSKRGVLIVAYAPMFSQGKGIEIYNLSQSSIITEFPCVGYKDGLNLKLPGYSAEVREKVMHNLEVTLARHDTFLIPVHNGARLGVNVLICESYESLVHQVYMTWQETVHNKIYIQNTEKKLGKTMAQLHRDKSEGYEEYVLDELSPGPEEWETFDSNKIGTPHPGEFIEKAVSLWREDGREVDTKRSWQTVLSELLEKQKVTLLSQAGLVEEQLQRFREV